MHACNRANDTPACLQAVNHQFPTLSWSSLVPRLTPTAYDRRCLPSSEVLTRVVLQALTGVAELDAYFHSSNHGQIEVRRNKLLSAVHAFKAVLAVDTSVNMKLAMENLSRRCDEENVNVDALVCSAIFGTCALCRSRVNGCLSLFSLVAMPVERSWR